MYARSAWRLGGDVWQGSMPYVDWTFLPDPVAQTGFTQSCLEELFIKYCGPLTPIATQKALSLLLISYKSAKTSREHAASLGLFSPRSLHSRLVSMESYLCEVLDEIPGPFDSRFHSETRMPEQVGGATGIIDVLPILIQRPSRNQRKYYSRKYGTHVVKVQAICNVSGVFIWYSGPHLGKKHDSRIFRENPPPIATWETILGDKGYCGAALAEMGIVAPIKKPPRGQLSEQQLSFNRLLGFFRVRVEHAFGFLKRHRILSETYRGRLRGPTARLHKTLRVLMHLHNLQLRIRPFR